MDGIIPEIFIDPDYERNQFKKEILPEPKPNMLPKIDYQAVNQQVWSLWFKIYGGGPSLVRLEDDIYSKAVDDPLERSIKR